jgi:hypothetical protein
MAVDATRLGRNTIELCELIQACFEAGVRLIFADGTFDSG